MKQGVLLFVQAGNSAQSRFNKAQNANRSVGLPLPQTISQTLLVLQIQFFCGTFKKCQAKSIICKKALEKGHFSRVSINRKSELDEKKTPIFLTLTLNQSSRG